jgi:hypothetical protein
MTKENRSAWPPYLLKPVSTELPADICPQTHDRRQDLWDRAQRLYAIGELRRAAQLFSQLAASKYVHQAGLRVEAING